MDIGMNLPVMAAGVDGAAILEWSRRIEAGPFSHIAVGERISFPNPELMVSLSAAAAVTQRVGIMANVLVLPMHSAVLKAKELATLDLISGGRLTVGLGAGARKEDFDAVGAPFGSRRLSQIEEQVATLRAVWSGSHRVPGALAPVEPLPLQAGGPPLLSASLSPRSIRRAARWADGICGFSFGPSLAEIEGSFEAARDAWREEGRDEAPRLVTSFWFALGKDARAQLDRYLERYLAFMGPEVAGKLAPTAGVSSAGALREVVEQLRSCGTDELSLVPTTTDPEELDRVADALG